MAKNTPIISRFNCLLAALIVAASFVASTVSAQAAVVNPTPKAQVSFTFDDGFKSVYTEAAPTLANYGLIGTSYVVTGCVGKVAVPNNCRANNDKPYMTWPQITELQNSYGWEIGSHTVSHPYLASSDASDGQPNVLSKSQVTQQLKQSKAALTSRGIVANSFAAPYGDYNMPVLAEIAKYYTSNRGFADTNTNNWPYNDYLLNNMPVQEGVTVTQVQAKIDEAIANNNWLILTFHDIMPNPSTNPDDYEYATSKLAQIAAYVKQKQDAGLLRSKNISNGLVTSDTNLLANSSFNSGIAGGWTTDAPTKITKDTTTKGSYPDATNAAKLISGATTNHLFSSKIPVAYGASYLLKNYLNVTKITSGELGFYIDEYDANGNWISGQYKGSENSVFVEQFNFSYQPTSANVTTARLQIYVSANAGITAYLDNAMWFETVAAPVINRTNLVANGTFDAGIQGGWYTNSPATIVADADGNGSPLNPQNSVRFNATTSNTHLFSPVVSVTATSTYTLSSYVRLAQITSGELGFYIDEYDASGNWISGQYKGGIAGIGSYTNSFDYTPSSTAIATAQLQYIVVGGSNSSGFIDNVTWYKD